MQKAEGFFLPQVWNSCRSLIRNNYWIIIFSTNVQITASTRIWISVLFRTVFLHTETVTLGVRGFLFGDGVHVCAVGQPYVSGGYLMLCGSTACMPLTSTVLNFLSELPLKDHLPLFPEAWCVSRVLEECNSLYHKCRTKKSQVPAACASVNTPDCCWHKSIGKQCSGTLKRLLN